VNYEQDFIRRLTRTPTNILLSRKAAIDRILDMRGTIVGLNATLEKMRVWITEELTRRGTDGNAR
jgi:hypothetical protein